MKLKVASSEDEIERIINQIDEDGNGGLAYIGHAWFLFTISIRG